MSSRIQQLAQGSTSDKCAFITICEALWACFFHISWSISCKNVLNNEALTAEHFFPQEQSKWSYQRHIECSWKTRSVIMSGGDELPPKIEFCRHAGFPTENCRILIFLNHQSALYEIYSLRERGVLLQSRLFGLTFKSPQCTAAFNKISCRMGEDGHATAFPEKRQ